MTAEEIAKFVLAVVREGGPWAALAVGLGLLAIKIRPAAAASPDAALTAQLTAQLAALTAQITAQGASLDELKTEVTDRLARVETNIENLKGRR